MYSAFKDPLIDVIFVYDRQGIPFKTVGMIEPKDKVSFLH